ncbi:MAG TPA: cytochrome c biogenesis protein CcdA [Bryobacteraceae bacterium]|nr:cytochrome c biogenesis protein CcdA [Bryobacteraceae bacterium]
MLGRLLVFALACAATLPAQKLNPVQWTLSFDPAKAPPGSKVLARVTAKLDPGWHLYALAVPKPIIPTSIKLAESRALASYTVHQPKPETRFDQNFGFQVASYESAAVFLLETTLAKDAPAGPAEITAEMRYQACDDKMCLPPRRVSAVAILTVDAAAPAGVVALPPGYTPFNPNAPTPTAPPPKQAESAAPAAAAGSQGIWAFLLLAFGFGLAAIFTPCVFPMIPITVSYFLNRPAATRSRSVLEAAVFCAGIIVLFSGLGLAATAILGPFGVVQLGSNIWVNTFVAIVFLVFGLSLLGAFEITIPSSVLTSLDRASQGGGMVGTLLMGLTFSLTAFACVGPFVGTLLAASVQGGGARPLAGMMAFAGGLATPFFFLAVFPSYLKRLPRSGGWMERVKVVMGFLILAAMFKYLSAVDQVMQWNVLTRERFLAIWIVLIALAGLYLLGLLRLKGVKPDESIGLGRLLTGAALLVFAIMLLPGMFGMRLGEIDAYVPPPTSGGILGQQSSGESAVWMKNQYRQALGRAREEGKLVLVNFTGYACTNCHWMKANMFPKPEIAAEMKNYVLVELYTDGTDDASRENQQLQESKFATIAIPYYAIVDPEERVVASFAGLTRDPQEFLAFLRSGPEKRAAI